MHQSSPQRASQVVTRASGETFFALAELILQSERCEMPAAFRTTPSASSPCVALPKLTAVLCLKFHAGPAGVPGGSAALEKQIEDLTVDLSKFTCEFFRVEVRSTALAIAGVACQSHSFTPCQQHDNRFLKG